MVPIRVERRSGKRWQDLYLLRTRLPAGPSLIRGRTRATGEKWEPNEGK